MTSSGEEFNIALDTAGHLNFLANEHNGAGNRRMSILDDTNEVSFDGNITAPWRNRVVGQHAEQDSVAAASLEGHVRAHDAFTGEAGPRCDTL